MDVLKLLFTALIVVSCSRVEYIAKQGIGQMKLLTGAEHYNVSLEGNNYSDKQKGKIKKIQDYKEYFYHYFKLPPDKIYSKVYKLKQKAVSYLVIASPFDEIKARNECFPFVGCFPYLGFFSEKDALSHRNTLEKDGLQVWIRPVYAYSTLGHFTDPILSSFFYYDDYQLANLIFHELFHTIFFIDDEVELNENLANFFAEQMTAEYFAGDPQFEKKHVMHKKWVDRGMTLMVKWSAELNLRYKKLHSEKREDFEKMLEKYRQEVITKDTISYCNSNIDNACWIEKLNINNAILAAYMTYEQDEQKILNLFSHSRLSLKEFFSYIKKNYKQLL